MKYIFLVLILLISAGNVVAWESGYDYRKSVTVDHVNSSGDTMINYPAMINVSKEAAMQADYDDVRFVAADDIEMSFELEKAYPDYAIYWVNITSLPSSGSTFWMYYGNDTASSGSNPETVWSSDYAMVQHLQESPVNGVAGHLDSTGNNNDGTPYGFGGVAGSTTDAEGMVDGANEFDGANDYVDCGNDPSLNFGTDNFSVSFWFKGHTTGWMELISKKGDASHYWGCFDGGTNYKIRWRLQGDATTGIAVTQPEVVLDNEWRHATWLIDRTNNEVSWYFDGVKSATVTDISTLSGMSFDSTSILRIGTDHIIHFFEGGTDEIRISNVINTPDHIKQDYEMVVNQSAIVSFGGSEDALHPFVSGANQFYTEMTCGLTNFRNDMGRYLIWAVIFFGISISFALMAKIKQTLIGGK